MDRFDAVVIGGGHNGLVAAAYLARAGWAVCVCERSDEVGGCVRTEELTLPGYRHDVMASWHPLFHLSEAFRELGPELADHGLAYCNTEDWTTATVRADGGAVIGHRDPGVTVEGFSEADGQAYMRELEGFGARAELVGRLMGTELHSATAARLVGKLGLQLERRSRSRFAADLVASCRAWLESRFEGREPGDLFAPWVLHTGLDPDAAGGGFLTLAIAATPHAVGMPTVAGGGGNFAAAFRSLIEAHGGEFRTGTEVEEIRVRNGRAAAVVAGGEEIACARAVIANTTPTQLHGRLLRNSPATGAEAEAAMRFRYSRRAGMQVHVALSAPLRWRDSRLDRVPVVHLADGIDQVALACAESAVGLLPRKPTVVVGQPTVLDPSRVPQGAGLVWIQLMEVPRAPIGDAAGEIDTNGAWEEAVTEAYVERVLERLRPHVANLDEDRLAVRTVDPRELEERNPNLVHGDFYGGDAALDQSYLWRPVAGFGSHRTAVEGLYQCGASTFPGPGLNAASGRIVAQAALAERSRIAGFRRRIARGRA